MDAEFADYLSGERRDENAEKVSSALLARAQELVAKRFEGLKRIEVDVVASACGYKILYFLGVYMILEAAGVKVKRFSGASSGGMTPMELVVLGTSVTVSLYCFYGGLQDRYPASFATSAWRADRHWKVLANHLFPESTKSASMVDDRVFTSITRLTWRGPRNVIVSKYGTQGRARSAYYATGTLVTTLDGYLCTDGGVTNGEPLFTDAARPQILIRPGKGLAHDMVARFSLSEAEKTIQRGQDDAISFLLLLEREQEEESTKKKPSSRLSFGGILFMLMSATMVPGACSWREEHAVLLRGGPDENVQPLLNQVGSWLGADCATSISGPGAKSYLWIFQDTILGNVVNGSRDRACMPHNSVAIYTKNDTLTHYLHGCDAFLSPISTDRWYWTETGHTAANGDVLVFSQVMTLPCSVGCNQVGIALTRLNTSIDPFNVTRWTEIETHNLPGFAPGVQWPTALFPVSKTTLGILGRQTRNESTTAFLARVPISTLESTPYSELTWNSTLAFLLADGTWATIPSNQSISALDLAPIFDDAPSETSMIRFPSTGEKRYITLNIPFGTPYLQIRWSMPVHDDEFPTDWSDPATIYHIPEPYCCTQTYSYSPKAHQEFTNATNELVVTFVSNSRNASVVNADLRIYTPRALRFHFGVRGG